MKEHTSYNESLTHFIKPKCIYTQRFQLSLPVNLQSADWHSLLLIDLSSPLNLFIFHKLWVHITYKFQMELS